MSDELLHAILLSLNDASKQAVHKAWLGGVAEGRRQATEEIHTQFESFFKNIAGQIAASSADKVAKATAANVVDSMRREASATVLRAAPGTVKPGLLQIINETPDGLTTEELIAMTGFKANSVRGTLSTLAQENAIVKVNDRWFSGEHLLAEGHARGNPEH